MNIINVQLMAACIVFLMPGVLAAVLPPPGSHGEAAAPIAVTTFLVFWLAAIACLVAGGAATAPRLAEQNRYRQQVWQAAITSWQRQVFCSRCYMVSDPGLGLMGTPGAFPYHAVVNAIPPPQVPYSFVTWHSGAALVALLVCLGPGLMLFQGNQPSETTDTYTEASSASTFSSLPPQTQSPSAMDRPSTPSPVLACPQCNGRGVIACPDCGGTGRCTACRGTGIDNAGRSIFFSDSSSPPRCPDCGGSGRCRRCGGTGKITCPMCGGRKNTYGYPSGSGYSSDTR